MVTSKSILVKFRTELLFNFSCLSSVILVMMQILELLLNSDNGGTAQYIQNQELVRLDRMHPCVFEKVIAGQCS